ncbi:MAG: competence/damage-inducible protein A [Actinomycetota bacterium]
MDEDLHLRHGSEPISGSLSAEIVGVGTELLLGQIANTNARWMSEVLAEIGVDVLYHSVVGDNMGRIVATLGAAADRVDVVLVTGGLGPTGDDITRDAIARVMGVGMVRHPELETMLRERFARYRGEMPASNLRQADVPEGARYVVPERGTAPGLVVTLPGGTLLYAMAGVPAEMREIMTGTVLPELAERAGPAVLRSQVIRCAGIGESALAERLDDLFVASRNPSVAYLASGGEVKVRLTAKASTGEEADALLRPLADEVIVRAGDFVFSTAGESLEEAIGRLLRTSGRSVATAESLTGGGIAQRLASVPGASAYFRGSAVTYLPEVKERVLGVAAATIAREGVVSEACAREMAAGARALFDADVAVAVTGVAGPEPHDGREPGDVWLALDADEATHARFMRMSGARDQIVRWTEQAALDLVRRHLEGRPLPASDRLI